MDPVMMESTQFYLDPALYFDPSPYTFTQFPPVAHHHYQSIGTLPTPPNSNSNTDDQHSSSSSSLTTKKRTRIRASRACIACRSRHMKCDAAEPRCTRCQIEEKTCVYAKSRRGGSNRSPEPPILDKEWSQSPGLLAALGRKPSSNISQNRPSPGTRTTSPASQSRTDDLECSAPSSTKLVFLYYEFFHSAHPVLLPRWKMLDKLQSDPDSFQHLLPVVEYVGSIYSTSASSENYLQIVQEILPLQELPLSSSKLPRNGYTVQALMLFSLALYCSDSLMLSLQYLNAAIDFAIEINMHRSYFATEFGENDPVLEESWRRTWWTLYLLDGMYAAITYQTTHRLQGVTEEVGLPCEEIEYESGKIPPPLDWRQYDNREFLSPGTEIVFSSFTYLIDAGRILSSILSTINCHTPSVRSNDAFLAATDAKYVNWLLYLPKCKQQLVREGDGKVDEVMFLAVLTINTQKLLLHRPHSHLRYSPIEQASKCTPPTLASCSMSLALHTAKSIEALTASITLFALPTPTIHHSPLTTCSLALAVMAQVSACNHVLKEGSPEYGAGRDRIRLGLGALRSGMQRWFSTSRSVREVVGVARELLAIGNEDRRSRYGDKAIGAEEAMETQPRCCSSRATSNSGSISDDGSDFVDNIGLLNPEVGFGEDLMETGGRN